MRPLLPLFFRRSAIAAAIVLLGLRLSLPALQPVAQAQAPAASKPAPDVLVFTNGDQLTGKLLRGVGDSVVFASDMGRRDHRPARQGKGTPLLLQLRRPPQGHSPYQDPRSSRNRSGRRRKHRRLHLQWPRPDHRGQRRRLHHRLPDLHPRTRGPQEAMAGMDRLRHRRRHPRPRHPDRHHRHSRGLRDPHCALGSLPSQTQPQHL